MDLLDVPERFPNTVERAMEAAAGPDGAIWFVESSANKVGRITMAGHFTEFPIPSAVLFQTSAGQIMTSGPVGITTGPDGALWFTGLRSAASGHGRY